jgi:glycosyltransferase involved in cell wall biosynthesis
MSSPYSVVVPVYNNQAWVGEAIASVLGQTYGELELIVIDDGSTDDTVAAVREYASDPRLRLIEQENSGPSAARNAGIAAADSEFVAFLDSDDLWMPEYLAKVDAALAECPDAGFAYVDAWRLDVHGRFFRASAMERQDPPDDPPRDPMEFLGLLIEHGNFVFVSTTVRSSALEEVGGFDTSLGWVEDLDLWIRILVAGYGAVRTGELLAIKRDRPGSLSGDERKMAVSTRDVYLKVAADDRVSDHVRASARKRAERVDHTRGAIERGDRGRAARRLMRGAAASLHRRAFPDRIWHPRTPPEIAAAFPHLAEPKSWEPAEPSGSTKP